MYDVPPHIRPPPPNEDDYEPQIDPVTYEGEFLQESRGCASRPRRRTPTVTACAGWAWPSS